jgi:hypothetical protein
MIIELRRQIKTENATIGRLEIIDNEIEFSCVTLENKITEQKIKGNSAIPSGEYDIEFMKYDTPMNKRYKNMFGINHHGMLHLLDVPNFQSIYIHIGNTHKDTDGCILVGQELIKNSEMINYSKVTYLAMYKIISKHLLEGVKVKIKIVDDFGSFQAGELFLRRFTSVK